MKRLDVAHTAGRKTDTKALKRFLEEQERFLQHMNTEMIPDEDVVAGHQPELGIPDAKSDEQPPVAEDRRSKQAGLDECRDA